MGLGLRIRNNLPANKPELWRRPMRALMRRLSLKIQAGLDPKFYTRPFIATLLVVTWSWRSRPVRPTAPRSR
jgi:hypothetical protein